MKEKEKLQAINTVLTQEVEEKTKVIQWNQWIMEDIQIRLEEYFENQNNSL